MSIRYSMSGQDYKWPRCRIKQYISCLDMLTRAAARSATALAPAARDVAASAAAATIALASAACGQR